MKNKGFTIIELLAVITIIAIIAGILVIAFSSIFDKTEENYYKSIEQNLLLSGNNYYNDNRCDLPLSGSSKVSIKELIEKKYIEPIKDTKGNECNQDNNGYVYVYRNDKTKNYNYEVCLKCGNYESKGVYCKGVELGEINIYSYLASSNPREAYDTSVSYSNARIIDNDDITSEISLEGVSYFTITDTRTNEKVRCDNIINNTCIHTFTKSGSYLVSGYDNKEQKMADDKIINLKIDRERPKFDIDAKSKYVIEGDNSVTNISINIINMLDDTGIRNISYCLGVNCTDWEPLHNTTSINLSNIGSGEYTVSVKVTDLSGKESEVKSANFMVVYLVELYYAEGNTEDFEVIHNKKYGYLNSLPEYFQEKKIKWKNNANTVIANENTVDATSRHRLTAEFDDVDVVTKPSNPEDVYCSYPTYNGENQLLTKNLGDNSPIIFKNNVGKDVREDDNKYQVTVELISGYSWDDNAGNSFIIECNILPKALTITAENKSMNYGATTPNYTYTTSGFVSGETVSNLTGTINYTIKSGETTINDVSNENAGTYQIVPSGYTSSNYNITFTDGTLTINKADTTTTLENKDVTYTGSPITANMATSKLNSNESNITDGSYTYTYYSSSSCTSGNVLTGAPTNAGTYSVKATLAETSNYNTSTSNCATLTINKLPCNPPTNLAIASDGIVTWTNSSNATSYQVKINNGTYAAGTSGTDYLSTLTSVAGTQIIKVKGLCGGIYEDESSEVSATREAYSVTLTRGIGVDYVEGKGIYLAGATVNIDASVLPGYTWSKWAQTNGGAEVSTTKMYSNTIDGNWAYTATVTVDDLTVTANASGGTIISTTGWTNASGNQTATKTVTYKTAYGTLPTVTKEGYTFNGWSLIPEGYQQVEYIQSNGSQRINTGVPGNSNDLGFEIKYAWVEMPARGYKAVFGSWAGQTFVTTRIIQYGSGDTYFNINSAIPGSGGSHVPKTAKTIYDDTLFGYGIHMNYTSNFTIDATRVRPSATDSSAKVMVFTDGGNSSNIKLYGFKMYNNKVLIRNLIPCYRKSDSIIGLYDTVNGVFYTNSGSSVFEKGNDVYLTAESIIENPENHTIYAHWTANNYTVTINAGNGISSVAGTDWTGTGTATMTKALPVGSTLDLSTITKNYKNGYSGNNYTITSGAGSISGSTFTVGASDTTITIAATKKTNTITFHKNGNGGNDISEVSCTASLIYYGEDASSSCDINVPSITVPEGFSVIGWSNSADSHVNNLAPESTLSISGSGDYYAQTMKESKTYTMNFNILDTNSNVESIGNNMGTCTIPATYNGESQNEYCEVQLPTITANSGYIVSGWYSHRSSEYLKVGIVGQNYKMSDTLLRNNGLSVEHIADENRVLSLYALAVKRCDLSLSPEAGIVNIDNPVEVNVTKSSWCETISTATVNERYDDKSDIVSGEYNASTGKMIVTRHANNSEPLNVWIAARYVPPVDEALSQDDHVIDNDFNATERSDYYQACISACNKCTLSLSAREGSINENRTGTFTFTSNCPNITVVSGDTSIATVSRSSNTVTMRGLKKGIVEITITAIDSNGKNANIKTYNLTVN